MPDATLTRTQIVARPLDETFAFFGDPSNLEAITPPWLRFEIIDAPGPLACGSRLRYRLRLLGMPIDWRTEITRWAPPHGFTDLQLSGPYRVWEHAHRFRTVTGGTEIYDHVRYRVPGGPLARFVDALAVRTWLAQIFDYRREQLAKLLA